MAPAGDNFVSMKALYDAADCGCRLCRSDKAGKDKGVQRGAGTNEVIPMKWFSGPVEDTLKGGSHRAFLIHVILNNTNPNKKMIKPRTGNPGRKVKSV